MPDRHLPSRRTAVRQGTSRPSSGTHPRGRDGFLSKTPGLEPAVTFWPEYPVPKMDTEDLDKWVWAMRFREPDWPRDKDNRPRHRSKPVVNPGHCWLCPDPVDVRGYCTRHYWQWHRGTDRSERSLRYRNKRPHVARQGPQKCKSKACWKKPTRYIEYCNRCYRKKYEQALKGKVYDDYSIDLRTIKPRQTRAEYRARELDYNRVRRERRAAARREKKEAA